MLDGRVVRLDPRSLEAQALEPIKALEETGEFTGYGSVFGNVDSYGEVVMPGAFKKSLAEHRRNKTRPKMFWQHDSYSPIGSWLEMAEDDTGLLVTGRLNMDVQKGAEAYALLHDGARVWEEMDFRREAEYAPKRCSRSSRASRSGPSGSWLVGLFTRSPSRSAARQRRRPGSPGSAC